MCVERTLGHRTHFLNLEQAARARPARVDLIPIDFPPGRWPPVPWAAHSSLAAYRRLRRGGAYDAVFFHTQTTALLAPRASRGRPYVVSVDATPKQFDAMGHWYDHRRGWGPAEAAKLRWYRRVLQGAATVVAWSNWARASLVDDYGVEPSRLVVVHPGADPEYFELERSPREARPRLLFVGHDFERKGGPALLRAFEGLCDRAELVLVTGAAVEERPGMRVVADAEPGSRTLLRAYAEADLFCLPTRADVTPVAIGEAMAAGLPVVATEIASIPEWVPPGAGVLLPPGDEDALRRALEGLIDDGEARTRMGAVARARARADMDAWRNASRVIDLITAAGR